MPRRSVLLALLSLSSACVLGAAIPRTLGAQIVRRLSDKDVPVLVNELRLRLNVPDTVKTPAPAPRRVSNDEFNALVGAAEQALQDLNDPKDLAQQESSAAQWGASDPAGANLRKEAQNRRNNLTLLLNQAAVLVPLLEKYADSTK